MRSAGILIDTPHLDDPARHVQAAEAVLVEALVTQAPVQALDKGILDRLAGRDVVPFDAAILPPLWDAPTGEFRSVVADNHARTTTTCEEPIERADNAAPRPKQISI